MIRMGSPGIKLMIMNVIVIIPSNTGNDWIIRRIMYLAKLTV